MKRNINTLFVISILIIAVSLFISFNNFSSRQIGKAQKDRFEEATASLEALQFFSEMRAYPDKEIPPGKFFKAFEYARDNMREIDVGMSPTQWSSIGPNNIGGRSLCLAVHPLDSGTIFMGSASGGLWKSTTGGLGASAWQLINTGYPSSAVSSIAIDSVNPNVIYIGTGENYGYQYSLNGLNIRVTRGMYGIGILKTTNAGAIWTKALDWSYNNQRGVWVVKLNPKNSNTVYAATSEGVYKSVNAGSTWTQVLNYQMAMDLEINPVDTSIVYVSIGNLSNDIPNANVGIYKSANSGASWVKLTGGLPSFWSGKATIELYKGNPDFVYASIPNDVSGYVGYYTSTNAGAAWTLRTSSISIAPQGWYNNAHLVKANDPNTIIVGTIDLVKSVNGGTTFTTKSNWSLWIEGATPPGAPESPSPQFAHADHHFFVSNPRDPNKLYCITDGGLYRSNDFGETYYSCNGGYVTTQFYNGFGNSYQDSIFCIGGLQDNRAAFYQGTVAWYKTYVGDGFWCAVNSLNHNTCYTEYTYGDMDRSLNGGVSWNGVAPPNAGSSSFYCFSTPFVACRSNPGIMYVGGQSVYKSLIGGGSWQGPYGNFNGGKTLSMDFSATSTDTGYIGTVPVGATPAAVWRTFDGGLTWTNVSGGVIPNRYPTDVHVNPNNSKDVFVTFSGFGTGHVYRSTNSGTSWTNITGNLPDLPHQSVVIDPAYPQNIYVGNDLGVYVTTNGGTNWYEYRNGMPYALVFDLTIVYPNRHIRATTHGNGVYERSLVQNPVGIISRNEIPKEFKLYQNYPNPFNPSTKIKFDVSSNLTLSGAKGLNVELVIYDILGSQVAVLVNENLKPGSYEIKFDASSFSTGVYFYKLTYGDITDAKRMVLIK